MPRAVDARRRSWSTRRGAGLEGAAGLLALLAYGVNLRSRTGADPAVLEATVTGALALYAK
ncbi:hypothetical protein [Streptomyces rimosus]